MAVATGVKLTCARGRGGTLPITDHSPMLGRKGGSSLRAVDNFELVDELPAVANRQFQLSQIDHQRVFPRLERAISNFNAISRVWPSSSKHLARCSRPHNASTAVRLLGATIGLVSSLRPTCTCTSIGDLDISMTTGGAGRFLFL